MSIRRCSPCALGHSRGARLSPALAVALACLLGVGCTSAAEHRKAIAEHDLTWRQSIPEDSHEDVLESIRELAEEDGPDALLSVPLMLRLVIGNPSSLVRAEALRCAWRLAGPLPLEALRPAALGLDEFQAASLQLEALLSDPDSARGAEATRLARLLCTQRFPPEQLNLAVSLADLATSRSAGADDETALAFAEGSPGVVRHAASLVTLRAATDRADVVREEAYRAIPWLHPQLGLTLAADALDHEIDGQRLLIVLDGIEQHADHIAAEDWQPLLDLAVDVDLGVARRIESLRGRAP